ncbi:MAG: Periplasmic component of the Tol biopolymer transport system-like protein, partial [Candidatus Solibacter sp.]|nr:Periplasmic component of the Tol biopolymer transport system-like protein [Candidatus Solibacter sp.]
MAYRNPWKIVAACLAALSVYLWFAHRPAPAPDLAFSPVTSDPGVTVSPAISADGQVVVYASDRDAKNFELYIQPLPRGVPVRLTSTEENETEPAISPDSSIIAFRAETSLFVMPARGGDRRVLVKGGHDPRYSPDGKSIAYWDGDASFVIPAAGGTPRRVFAEIKSVRHPIWSPDGALLMARAGEDYVVGAPDGKAEDARVAMTLSDNANWTAAGLVLVARTGWVRNIWRVPLDARGRASGAPVRLTRGAESTGDLAVSRDGRMIFTMGTQRFNVWGLPLEGGVPYRITDGPATTENPAISEDGRRLLYDAQRYGVQQVFLRDLQSGTERVVASGPMGATGARWLPDGRFVYRQRTDVYLDSQKLATGAIPWGADPKGEILLLESEGRIETLNLKTLVRTPFLHPIAGRPLSQAWFSPDGTEVVLTAGTQIYRSPVRDPRLIPVAEGAAPRWSPDGRLIYVLR